MASVMVIVSKAVFETMGKAPSPGDVLAFDRYASTHKALAALAGGGALYLVTVRPPDEALWLVGILDAPTQKADGWYATNATAIRDITDLIPRLVFANGKGLTAKPGALAMSLQTPRVLADSDVALLRLGKGPSAARASATKVATAKPASSKAARPKPASPKPASPKPASSKAARPKPASPKPASAKPASAKPASPKRSSVTASRGAAAAAVDAGAAGALDAVAAALDANDAVGALAAALVAWRAQRAPVLAELVETISAKIADVEIADERAFSIAARTRDAAALGGLVAAVSKLPVSFLPHAAEQLAAFPDDPRLALAVARWTHEPPTMSSSTHAFWTKSLEACARIGDPRSVPVLKARLRKKPGGRSQFWGKLYKGIEKALAKMDEERAPAGVDTWRVDERAVGKLAKRAEKIDEAGGRAPRRGETSRVEAAQAAPPPGPPLARALAHLEAGRVDEAIAAMCAAWRELGRHPQLADAIDRATRLLRTWEVPLAATDIEVAVAWDAAFADDPQATMPQLLQNVMVGGPKIAERHLVDLGTVADDPRVAMRLAALCCGTAAGPERTQFWKSVLEQIARIADPRVARALCTTFKDFTGNYYDHHRQARRIIGGWAKEPPTPPALGPQPAAWLAKIEAQVEKLAAKRDTTERDLLAAIGDAWDDVGPRLVYADWLGERQHPRGEAIVLACQARRTPAEEKRLQEIYRKTSNLYGALETVTETYYARRAYELDRGLPSAVTIRRDSNPFVWRELVGHPLMSTIGALHFDEDVGATPPAALAAVLLDPTARRLGRVHAVPQAYWIELQPHVDGKWKQKGIDLVRA